MALTYQYRYVHVYDLNQTNSTGLGYWVAEYSADSGTTWRNIDARVSRYQSELEAKQALGFITGVTGSTDDSNFVTQVTSKLLGSQSTATTWTGA